MESSNPTHLNSDRNSLLKAWIAAILWLIVIAIESTAYLSAHNTSRILFPILHFIFGMDWVRFEFWHFYIRKGGHVVGYGILSFLLFRAWRATLPSLDRAGWMLRWSAIAVLGTAIVASLDEWHQSFIPSRTGRWQDVVLDTCAGIAAQILIFLWWSGRGKSTLKPGSGPSRLGNMDVGNRTSLTPSETAKDAVVSR
jgi:VanZ family protein